MRHLGVIGAAMSLLSVGPAAPAMQIVHETPEQRPSPGRKARRAAPRTNDVRVFANLSRFHPDYGMSPVDHAMTKEQRAQGKVLFVPKETLRTRRLGMLRGMGR